MTRFQRNLLAGLAYITLLILIGCFDLILAFEAGLLSAFGALLIRQSIRCRKTKEDRTAKVIGAVAIFFIGAFFYMQLVVLSAYVVAAHTSMHTSSRLREIGIAIHNWHKDRDSFPAVASYASDGKPLLSWRVHLLPYLGHEELYKRFRLDEPWNSPHNLSLLPSIPECYRLPQYGRQAPSGGTYYQMIVGPGTVFEIGKKTTLGQLAARGRVSNTIIAGIAVDAVPWTKPADLVFEEGRPLALGKNMRHFPTSTSRLLLWCNDEPGESNRSYRVLFADAAIRGVQSDKLKFIAPYVIWRGETPQDNSAID